jgi:hypothetical protein
MIGGAFGSWERAGGVAAAATHAIAAKETIDLIDILIISSY